MWINTNFATAEPRHFEMQKNSLQKENFLKQGVFQTGFEPGTTKTIQCLVDWPTIRTRKQDIQNTDEIVICII